MPAMKDDPDDTLAERHLVSEDPVLDTYEYPEITDYGVLAELTLSGSSPLSDSFGGSAGGGS
jgi:hypothetical protein